MDDLALASDFPPATRDAWEAAVGRVLKGAEFERTLVARTHDGLRIEPIYPKADGAPPLPAGRGAGPWRVAARIDHPDPEAAAALALADLEGGADALTLSLSGSFPARGFGLVAESADALDRALHGVRLDLIRLAVEAAPFAGRAAAGLVTALAERRGHEPAALSVDFGLDPVGDIARTGRPPMPWRDLARAFAATAGDLRARGFGGTAARIDARPYHEAGASEAQELAAALATGVAYLRALEAGGFGLEAARAALSVLLVADADELLSVAKLRAFRRLWASIEESCGLAPAPIHLAAESSWRTMTRRDPWTNLLRGTLAGFSAGIGGADAVTILPFTAALGLPDAFARRLARNTQLLLLEEANIARVGDPVAGSGAFEALTAALVTEAWRLFQQIEREGGIVASLAAGALPGRIAAARRTREAAFAAGREPLIGSSVFPDLRELPVSVLLPAISPRPRPEVPGKAGPRNTQEPVAASLEADRWSAPQDEDDGHGHALPSLRLAQPVEALRDRSDAILAATGRRPLVFLATLGPLSAFSARATFAANAFAAVGVESVGGEATASIRALVAAFGRSGAAAACLCSSDEVYGAQARSAAESLREAGCRPLFLAGRPGHDESELRKAGVSGFLHVRSDLPRELGALLGSPAVEP